VAFDGINAGWRARTTRNADVLLPQRR